tara:strand:+ start:356 stop:640 length:285 start_codon:yes stop_codon:yes gene_type:complete
LKTDPSKTLNNFVSEETEEINPIVESNSGRRVNFKKLSFKNLEEGEKSTRFTTISQPSWPFSFQTLTQNMNVDSQRSLISPNIHKSAKNEIEKS